MHKHYRRLTLVWLLLLLSGMWSLSQAQALVWGKRVGGTGGDAAYSIAVDAAGNTYISGIFSGSAAVDFDPSPTSTASLTSLGDADAFIAKYDAAGNYLWAKPLAGSGNGNINPNESLGFNIAVDASGNCYITGTFGGTVDFDPSPSAVYSLTSAEGSANMVLAKYTTDGNFLWAVRSSEGAAATSLALDGSGNIFVTGGFRGTVSFGPSQTATVTSANTGPNGTETDFFVARFTPAGVPDWIRTIGGNGSANGTDIGVDGSGNVCVKASFIGTLDIDPTTNTKAISSTNGLAFLIKYNSAGVYQWANQLPNQFVSSDLYGLKVDAAGNSYVTGPFRGTGAINSITTPVVSLSAGVNNFDSYVVKYNSDGNSQWAFALTTTSGLNWAQDIEADASGNCYLLGIFAGTTDFDPSTGVASLSAASGGLYMAKYGPSGGYIQATKIDSPSESIYRLALDNRANWYIAGTLTNAMDVDPSAGVTTLTSAGGSDVLLAKYTDCLSITAQPAAGSAVCAGGSATATVGVSGTVSGYQWYRNGTPVNGQTAATLSLTNVQAADAGSYVVVVTNACVSLTSTSFSLAVGSGILHVTESGTGLQNGSSWANALPGSSLQYAIDQAAACASGQVWVAAGTYKPTTLSGPDSRTVSFSMRNNVAIYGGFTGSETALSGRPAVNPVTGQPSSSTLSGEIGDPNSLTDNSYNIFNNFRITTNALLDGFVLTGAYNYDFGENYNTNGGAINNVESIIDVSNCLFVNNAVDGSGGCITFRYPSLTVTATTPSVLSSCVFRNNTATTLGGAIYFSGSPPSKTVRVINSIFDGNSARRGGAVYVINMTTNTDNVSKLEMSQCQFRNNTATDGGALAHNSTGGNKSRAQIALLNCGFLNNSATSQGGVLFTDGIQLTNLSVSAVNCSFQGNIAATGPVFSGTIADGNTREIILKNSVLAGNGPAPSLSVPGFTVVASNSLFNTAPLVVGELISSPGNLTTSVSPYASTTGLQLALCSPAIDAGDPSTTSAVVGTTDLAGNSRFYQGGRIDMGAYEFQGASAPPVSYTVLGSGTATCAASPTITLSGSETGVSYQLRRDGTNSGAAVAGTGSAISFGPQSLSGVYTVLATSSSSSCTLVMPGSATVVSTTAVPSLTLSPSATTLSCSSPVVSLSATGAGQLRWSTGATTPVISVSAAGTYSVTVTDGNSCTATASAVVSGTLLGTATVSADGPIGCGRTSAQVSVQASGATSYTLSGPNGYNQTNNTGVFSVSAGGSYTGVAGQAGCVASNTVVVTEGGAQPVISSVQASGGLGSGNCSVSVQATGYGDRYELTGPGGYVFSVVYRTVGDHSVNFPTVVKPGTYTLTVYSGNCVVTRTVTVSGTACP